MNITFLIGNGFDVNLGLKTQYTDFYPKYIKANEHLTDDNCIKKFCLQIKDNYKNWSDFEWAFAQNAKGTQREIGEILANFDDLFADYLKEQCERCNYNISGINDKLRQFIDRPYTYLVRKDMQYLLAYYKRHGTEGKTFNFISFNYTDTLDNMLSQELKNTISQNRNINGNPCTNTFNPILHLHGSLKEGYMIVAIDSLEQLKDDEMKTNSKLGRHCVKRIINEQNGYQDKEDSYKNIISKSNVIYVYGIAFGETDRSRWEVIKTWLKKSKEHKLIIFKYNSGFETLNRMSKSLMLDEVDKARDEYLKILGFEEEEYEGMYDQIFVTDSSKALDFKLINENN